MAAFEWMELQSLTGDITEARSRLAEARSAGDDRRVRGLEQEIAAAEKRRAGLLAFLTSHLADAAPPAVPHSANEDTPPADAIADDAPAVADFAEERPVAADDIAENRPVAAADIAGPAPEPADRAALCAALAGDLDPDNSSLKGGNTVWEQLTPGDLERAEQELAKRREEMLARHAEELRALDVDREGLAGLEQSIAEFVRKFGPPTGAAEVVQLGDEREMRALGGR
jgi:hypothetical protein